MIKINLYKNVKNIYMNIKLKEEVEDNKRKSV